MQVDCLFRALDPSDRGLISCDNMVMWLSGSIEAEPAADSAVDERLLIAESVQRFAQVHRCMAAVAG